MSAVVEFVDWVSDCIAYMHARQLDSIEADRTAEDDWVRHVNEVAYKTLYPSANSWYMGANIPGKPRVFMPYIGGVGQYRETCDQIAAGGYTGFQLRPPAREAVAAE